MRQESESVTIGRAGSIGRETGPAALGFAGRKAHVARQPGEFMSALHTNPYRLLPLVAIALAAVAGLIWLIPAGAIIWWMERPESPR